MDFNSNGWFVFIKKLKVPVFSIYLILACVENQQTECAERTNSIGNKSYRLCMDYLLTCNATDDNVMGLYSLRSESQTRLELKILH